MAKLIVQSICLSPKAGAFRDFSLFCHLVWFPKNYCIVVQVIISWTKLGAFTTTQLAI